MALRRQYVLSFPARDYWPYPCHWKWFSRYPRICLLFSLLDPLVLFLTHHLIALHDAGRHDLNKYIPLQSDKGVAHPWVLWTEWPLSRELLALLSHPRTLQVILLRHLFPLTLNTRYLMAGGGHGVQRLGRKHGEILMVPFYIFYNPPFSFLAQFCGFGWANSWI